MYAQLNLLPAILTAMSSRVDSDGEEVCANAMPQQKAHDTGYCSDDELCCPISEEDYEEKGIHQVFLLLCT